MRKARKCFPQLCLTNNPGSCPTPGTVGAQMRTPGQLGAHHIEVPLFCLGRQVSWWDPSLPGLQDSQQDHREQVPLRREDMGLWPASQHSLFVN